MFQVRIEDDGTTTQQEFPTELEARQFAVNDVITKLGDFIVEDEENGDGLEGKYLWGYTEAVTALLNNPLPITSRLDNGQTTIVTEV